MLYVIFPDNLHIVYALLITIKNIRLVSSKFILKT